MDFTIEKKATTKAADGKKKHVELDGDLHSFLRKEAASKGMKFREFANKLFRMGIRKYISDSKLPDKIAEKIS